MRVILDLLHELTNTRIFGLFHDFMWQSRYSEVNVHLVERCGRTGWLSNHNGSPRPIMIYIYVLSLSLSLSKRSTNKLVFLQSRKKRVSISWALEWDVCSVTTGLPVPSWFGLGFGWVGWLTSACRSTSEPNSFIQSCLKEIFGGIRGDSKTFSSMTSPVSIRTTFG